MKKVFYTGLTILSLCHFTNAQITWQTTHNGTSNGNCQLQSEKITATVYPFHVDVEEEASLTTRGNVGWGDSSTLEITGTFTFSSGTILRSMLLWNGQKILKAKLRDRIQADSSYEAVVDRSKPQFIPRDPALIEYMGLNQYRFKIYPVTINGTRKLRILYTIPLHLVNGQPVFTIQPAFTFGALENPAQIPVEIKKAESVNDKYMLQYGSVRKTIQFGGLYQIPQASFTSAGYYSDYYRWVPPSANPLKIILDTTIWNKSFVARTTDQSKLGYYTAVFSSIPDTILSAIKELNIENNNTIEVQVGAGNKIYISDNKEKQGLGIYLKSTQPWDSIVRWNLYDNNGDSIMTCKQKYSPQDDSITDSMLPLIWGAKYSLTENQGNLGALYGFVDRKMSLLALESDTLSKNLTLQYGESGVPLLLSSDIILKPSLMPIAPSDNVIFEYGTDIIKSMLGKLVSFKITFTAGNILSIYLSNITEHKIRVVMTDLKGRNIQTWENVVITSAGCKLHVPNVKGFFVLKVYAGKDLFQKKIILK